MESKQGIDFQVDCTCLDLFEKLTKKYRFSDCEVLKKCIQNGILDGGDSVCICGKEQSGKTLLVTEILADLTAVKELKGMNCKVIYFDCDLSFSYKNYKNIIYKKIAKYIYGMKNGTNTPVVITNEDNRNYEERKKLHLKEKKLFDASFSNVYYIPIFNPGHFIIILNSLKNLLESKPQPYIEALIIDSLTFWNYCKYDKTNFFSDENLPKRSNLELLDYAFTCILNLKRKYKFLLFYSKVHNESKSYEYTINMSTHHKFNQWINGTDLRGDKNKRRTNTDGKYENNNSSNTINNMNSATTISAVDYMERTDEMKKKFLIPTNFGTLINIHIFQKKDFTNDKVFVERPFLIYLIPNEKKEFIHIKKKYDIVQPSIILCISSAIKDIDKINYSNFLFMITNSYTFVPL